MLTGLKTIRHKLAAKLILMLGLILIGSFTVWAHYNLNAQKNKLMAYTVENTDRLTNTIRLGAHYSMMSNSREDINQIIKKISTQPEFEEIRIYNKIGQVKFSNKSSEINKTTNIRNEACVICHRSEPPITHVDLVERIRVLDSEKGYRILGIISPIYNEPACANADCHFHPDEKKVLGALDVVVSLESLDAEIVRAEKHFLFFSILIFAVTSAIIFLFILRFVNQPIKGLIHGARRVAKGDYSKAIEIKQTGEIRELANAFNLMCKEILKHETELKTQKTEYQNLFESVPCLITVQDRSFKLLNYNREFSNMFNPTPGDFCYRAYKGRDEKCDSCPVERVFEDGFTHHTEETGPAKDGDIRHWIVKATPVLNDEGTIVAAMEISLDITERKNLEVELVKSEEKYHAIFSNIPNPVFVLDPFNHLIMDANNSVEAVYGYKTPELINRSFLALFPEKERGHYASKLMISSVLDRVKNIHKSGKTLFVNIRISPTKIREKRVLLVTTSDITKRLEAEQQLIHAGKMATLGEMATGIAHELNQPLSVIKTVSSFFIEKIRKKEPIESDTQTIMLTKVDSNVDRATKIINHMRQFARKSEMELESTQVNDIIHSALEIFSQQLKTKGIEILLQLDSDLPRIYVDPSRLEQVVINLLVNARDAIEDKWNVQGHRQKNEKIELVTRHENGWVIIEVRDSGTGIPENILEKIFEPFFTTK
jgi:histidine kinase